MELKDLQELVNHKLVTDVTLYDHYKSNPEALTELDTKTAMMMGLVSQPEVATAVVDKGIAILPNNTILSAEDLMAELALGGVVTLKNNIEVDSMITVSSNVVLDLNGYSITKTSTTASGKNVLFYVKGDGAKLTIKGDGDVNVKSGKTDIAVWSDKGAEVNIEGGNFYGIGESTGSDLIYAMNGKINVSGGSFKLDTMSEESFAEPQYTLLNAYGANINNAKDFIVVTGGTFYGFNPADNVSEGRGTNFVADGYESIEDGDWFIVRPVTKTDIVVDEE